MKISVMSEVKVANEKGTYVDYTGEIDWGYSHGTVKNATFILLNVEDKPKVVFKTGTWVDGTLSNAHWCSGTWENGVFDGGLWCDGCWINGHWKGEHWMGGIWIDGEGRKNGDPDELVVEKA